MNLYNGHTLREWSEITGIKYSTLARRLDLGWDIDRALSAGSRVLVCCGEVHTIKEWSGITGIKAGTIRKRLSRGMTVWQALHYISS